MAKKVGSDHLCVFYQFDIPLFYFFLIVNTPPLFYHDSETPENQNGWPVGATADSHLVLSMPNEDKFADEQLNISIFQECFLLPPNKTKKNPNKTKCSFLLFPKCFKRKVAWLSLYFNFGIPQYHRVNICLASCLLEYINLLF